MEWPSYLFLRRCWDSHIETATVDGWDDFTGGIAAQDEAARCSILLHGSPESMLSILSQSLHLS